MRASCPPQVIAEHLFRVGKFDVGEAFSREAGIPNADALKQPYVAMHAILKEVRLHIYLFWKKKPIALMIGDTLTH